MKITVLGAGYAGLTVATCLSNLGNEVVCVDVDNAKIEKLNAGIIPIYEPGLKELVDINKKEERLFFTTNAEEAIKDSLVVFIAVGTPMLSDGSADLKYVDSAAELIGKNINGYKVIVNKSTVPVGTAERVSNIIKKFYDGEFDVVSNPEFLREGAAVKDFFNPDRVVIGADSQKAREVMVKIYKAVERTGKPIILTDTKSAELIKYASNAFLATKISFINEISNICEKVHADVKAVSKGVGLDSRIGSRFLQAGVGYGGSCFPKDIRALINTGEVNGYDFKILKAVDLVNNEQRLKILPKLNKHISSLNGKTVTVWGLAFKPKTDDIREAPSITVINQLLEAGAKVKAFDPVAQEQMKLIFPDISYCKTPYEAVTDSDALIILTEWDQFRELDLLRIKHLLNEPIVIDGRNIYSPVEMSELGFKYESFGRGVK